MCKGSAFFDGSNFYSDITIKGDITWNSGSLNWETKRTNASLEIFSFNTTSSDNIREGTEDDQLRILRGSSRISRSSPSGSIVRTGNIYFYDGEPEQCLTCGFQGNVDCKTGEIKCIWPPDYCDPGGLSCAYLIDLLGDCNEYLPAQIIFDGMLKLYNDKGEEVGLEAFEYPPSYDSCYAIAQVGAPSCHFFAS
jgi:hypothetical protein